MMRVAARGTLAETEELGSLIREAADGNQRSLKEVVRIIQRLVFDVSQKFYLHPEDAEDAAQEILMKVITRLGSFDPGRGSARSWILGIARNHLIDVRRRAGRMESVVTGLEDYFGEVDRIPDEVLSDQASPTPEETALIMEANVSCMLGMLLCLDREQRMVLIVGDVLGLPAAEAASVFDLSSAAFRQRLHRARADLYSFMHDRCGLVNRANPCRCQKKAKGFAAAGWINRETRTWTDERYRNVAAYSSDVAETAFSDLYDAYAGQFRALPAYDADKPLVNIGDILQRPDVANTFRLNGDGSE